MKTVDPGWKAHIRSELDRYGQIDQVVGYLAAAQWLVEELTRRNKDFKVYQLGAGVKRITTDTDTCPCCKRPL